MQIEREKSGIRSRSTGSRGDGHRELAANEEEPHHQHSGDLRQHQLSGLPLGETAQGGDQQPEGKGIHNGARQIEADDFAARAVGRQKAHGQNKGDDAGEARLLKTAICHEARERDRCGDSRAGRRRDGNDKRVNAHAATKKALRINQTDQRGVDAHQRGAAQSPARRGRRLAFRGYATARRPAR